jgi:dTDP-4-amino-4,6-dideoxygalactose transaminase
MPGHNYRLTDIQAALVLAQLDGYEANVAARRANADLLTEGLTGIDGLIVPTAKQGRGHVWHQYTVRITPEARVSREELAQALTAAGIGHGVYYPRTVFDYDCYRQHPQVKISPVPIAEQVAAEVLSLPVHPGLVPGDVDQVIAAVRKALA